MHEMVKHPDSSLMRNEGWKAHILSRNWKHLAVGSAFWGASWSLGTFALAAQSMPAIMAAYLGGPVAAVGAAYSDCTPQNPGQELVPVNQEDNL